MAEPTTCPACGQPKGRGYGCAVLGPERAWKWVADGEFTELCRMATCDATDATHYHKPQDAHSVDSDVVAVKQTADCHCAVLLPALRRWLVARDATTGMIPADLPVDQVIAMCDEADAANDALVALAREVSS